MEVGPSKTVELPSRRYGRYIVRSRLGEGGMAEVFLAEAIPPRGHQFPVALKLLRKDVPLEAFADEADLMGLLDHPNLVRKLESGQAFGRPFIAMEFLVGGDLQRLIEAHETLKRQHPAGHRRLRLHRDAAGRWPTSTSCARAAAGRWSWCTET